MNTRARARKQSATRICSALKLPAMEYVPSEMPVLLMLCLLPGARSTRSRAPAPARRAKLSDAPSHDTKKPIARHGIGLEQRRCAHLSWSNSRHSVLSLSHFPRWHPAQAVLREAAPHARASRHQPSNIRHYCAPFPHSVPHQAQVWWRVVGILHSLCLPWRS